uniref:Retrovirus-related Pol polyprotein from transposon TNT 1-94-like beta-barrel domain-containing protein n=1 Tax=Oryza punctata TaxID=4537 RepID=A0A0E0MM34_ORYPU
MDFLHDFSALGQIRLFEPFDGSNYAKWKANVLLNLGILNYNYAIREDRPEEPFTTTNGAQKGKAQVLAVKKVMLRGTMKAFGLGLLGKGLCSMRTLRKGEWILRVADGAEIKVMAIGDLHRFPSSNNLLLHDVLYAPSIKRNLISVMVLSNFY